jgi:hypothetical protein
MFVLPDWDMVIVRLGRDQAGGFFFERRFYIDETTWSEFLRKIGESILHTSDATEWSPTGKDVHLPPCPPPDELSCLTGPARE